MAGDEHLIQCLNVLVRKKDHAPRVTLHRDTKRQTVRKRNPTVGARRNTIYDLFRLRDGKFPRLKLLGHRGLLLQGVTRAYSSWVLKALTAARDCSWANPRIYPSPCIDLPSDTGASSALKVYPPRAYSSRGAHECCSKRRVVEHHKKTV